MTDHLLLLQLTTLFSKPKGGKQHLLQIMLIEQLCIVLDIAFDKVQDRQGLQNISAQILVILSFYFCGLPLEKLNHEETIVCGNSWKPMDDKEFKVLLRVIILIGVYNSNNKSVKWLWTTLDGHFQSHYE